MKRKYLFLIAAFFTIGIVTASILIYYGRINLITNVESPIQLYNNNFVLDGELNDNKWHNLAIEGKNSKDLTIPSIFLLEVYQDDKLLANQEGLDLQLSKDSSTKMNNVTYYHQDGVGTANKDCFKDDNVTCITRGLTGAPYNLGTGTVQWGCGKCSNVSKWYSGLTNQFNSECVGGVMSDIINKDVCLQTENAGMWNIDFTSFGSGGGGEFGYNRNQFSYELNNITLVNGSYSENWSIPSGDFARYLNVKGVYNIQQGEYEFVVTLLPK